MIQYKISVQAWPYNLFSNPTWIFSSFFFSLLLKIIFRCYKYCASIPGPEKSTTICYCLQSWGSHRQTLPAPPLPPQAHTHLGTHSPWRTGRKPFSTCGPWTTGDPRNPLKVVFMFTTLYNVTEMLFPFIMWTPGLIVQNSSGWNCQRLSTGPRVGPKLLVVFFTAVCLQFKTHTSFT